jgi:hypothetical protein
LRKTPGCDPVAGVDVAMFAEPHAFSEGIERVYVYGSAALADGKIAGMAPGRVTGIWGRAK